MMQTIHSRVPHNYKSGFIAAVLILFVAAFSLASEEADTSNRGMLHLMVEPAIMRTPLSEKVPGSNNTIITPAVVRGDFVNVLDQETWDRLGLKSDSVRRVAMANAARELANLTPRFLRDDQGVIQAAIIDSDRPVVASTVLAPNFIKTFEPVFGPDLLVAIPNRYRVYVYPALASKFEFTANSVIADYKMTPFAVSREVFRVTPDGLAAVGIFEDPSEIPKIPR